MKLPFHVEVPPAPPQALGQVWGVEIDYKFQRTDFACTAPLFLYSLLILPELYMALPSLALACTFQFFSVLALGTTNEQFSTATGEFLVVLCIAFSLLLSHFILISWVFSTGFLACCCSCCVCFR